jgi:hypothetical protein
MNVFKTMEMHNGTGIYAMTFKLIKTPESIVWSF